MLFKTIIRFLRKVAHSPLTHVVAEHALEFETSLVGVLPIAVAATAHWLVTPSPNRQPVAHRDGRRHGSLATLAACPVNRTGKTLARAAIRTAYAGQPLAPTGYLVTLSAVAIVGLVALVRTCWSNDSIDDPQPELRALLGT